MQKTTVMKLQRLVLGSAFLTALAVTNQGAALSASTASNPNWGRVVMPKEADSVSNDNFIPPDFLLDLLKSLPIPSGVYIDPDGNPATGPNYYYGDFNQNLSQFPGVTWEIRVNGSTVLKGYGNTYKAVLEWAMGIFRY